MKYFHSSSSFLLRGDISDSCHDIATMREKGMTSLFPTETQEGYEPFQVISLNADNIKSKLWLVLSYPEE